MAETILGLEIKTDEKAEGNSAKGNEGNRGNSRLPVEEERAERIVLEGVRKA